MDACLMTMLEVAYQIRDHARVLVGSQELEPGPGWPYATVFADLVARPAMTLAELGAAIVGRYAEFYDVGPRSSGDSRHRGADDPTDSRVHRGPDERAGADGSGHSNAPGHSRDRAGAADGEGPDITQSAIDLAKLDDVVGVVDALAGTLVIANAEAMRQGFARVLTIPPNLRHRGLLLALQREAREAGRGLWARV
jgi:hypothetical protein